MDASKILATHIPKDGAEDELDWKFTKSGNYSAKSGYWFLNPNSSINQSEKQFWRFIWNSGIFPKWKHFLWKIAVKAIPTASNLTKRQIYVDLNCKFCKQESEDEDHLLKNCKFTQRIWASTMGIKVISDIDTPIKDWIRNFLNVFRKKRWGICRTKEELHRNTLGNLVA